MFLSSTGAQAYHHLPTDEVVPIPSIGPGCATHDLANSVLRLVRNTTSSLLQFGGSLLALRQLCLLFLLRLHLRHKLCASMQTTEIYSFTSCSIWLKLTEDTC